MEKLEYVKCWQIGVNKYIYIPLGDYIEITGDKNVSEESIYELTVDELIELESKEKLL